jgi:hypothetical protein
MRKETRVGTKSEVPEVSKTLRVPFAVLVRAQNCLSHGLKMRLTGRGSLASALFIATVMTWMVSGVNDTF